MSNLNIGAVECWLPRVVEGERVEIIRLCYLEYGKEARPWWWMKEVEVWMEGGREVMTRRANELKWK
jgi:hypothetical protein